MPTEHKVFSLQLTNKEALEKKICDKQKCQKKISTVMISHKNNGYSFLDASKKEHRAQLTMFNIDDHSQCFWCRHSFKSMPMGCPIDHKNSHILKSYFSEITKDTYDIVGSVSNSDMDEVIKQHMSVMNKSHFLVDGIFCSFNCCMAFIEDNCKNMLYDNSKQLLYKMYHLCFPETPLDYKIIPAPHWRLLKLYGGNLTIEEFRKHFNQIHFVSTDITNKCVSWIFREDIIF